MGAPATPSGSRPAGHAAHGVDGGSRFDPSREWIEHTGGDCPINRDTTVRFKFASGKESEREYRAGDFLWRKRGWAFDIEAYQIIGDAPGETDTTWTPKSGGY